MFNEENALLLRSIIAHLSIDCPCDSAALTGDQDQVLDGLRGEGTEHGFRNLHLQPRARPFGVSPEISSEHPPDQAWSFV